MIVNVGKLPTRIQFVNRGDLIFNTGAVPAYVDTTIANVLTAPASSAIPVLGGATVQWAGTPGMLYGADPTGNAPGIGVTSHSGLPFPAPTGGPEFIANNQGFFFYGGPPGKGTLIAAIVGAATADPYGDNTPAVFNVGIWDTVTGNLKQHFGLDGNGRVFIAGPDGAIRIMINNGSFGTGPDIRFFNDFGAVIQVVDPSRGGNFQYQDNNSAVQGTLIGSQVGKNTTDPVNGTTQNAGINVIDPVFGDFLQIVGANIFWGIASNFTKLAADAVGLGSTNQGPFRSLAGPEQGVAGHPVIRLFGTSPDGTRSAGVVISTTDPPARQTSELLEIQGTILGTLFKVFAPGSTSTEESDHPVTFQNGWANTGGTNTPAQYRLGLDNTAWLMGDISGGTTTDGTTIFTLPAGYRPAHDVIVPIATGGATGGVTNMPNIVIQAGGAVQVNHLGAGTNRISFHQQFRLDS